jgi:hypothetical protein
MILPSSPFRRLCVGALTAMLATITACSTLRVRVDRDPAVPLPAGATWAFRGHSEPEGPEAEDALDNPIVHQRIERLIAQELEARGYHQVGDPSSATLLVHYHLGVKERRETVRRERPTNAYRPVTTCEDRGRTCTTRLVWGPYGPPEVTYRQYTYKEGAIVVDVIDQASGHVAWRAIGQRRLRPGNDSEEAMHITVARIMRDLPAPVAGRR